MTDITHAFSNKRETVSEYKYQTYYTLTDLNRHEKTRKYQTFVEVLCQQHSSEDHREMEKDTRIITEERKNIIFIKYAQTHAKSEL